MGLFSWLGNLVDSNEKEINRLEPLVEQINELETEFGHLSDEELKAKTGEFKTRLAEATAAVHQKMAETSRELDEARLCLADATMGWETEERKNECKRLEHSVEQAGKELRQREDQVLDELLPEAFAAVREAARRAIGQRHFNVQLIGGIVLHQGKIAEMKTGEGKTLVATLPMYLNSLTGRGCHLVTVNDYLARRDPYWMGPVFTALGVSVASIYPQQKADEFSPARRYDPEYDSGDERWRHFRPIPRKEAYQSDITYGTSAEFGFDYLRDNMVIDLKNCVQREQNYAIVDEVDNLLIDEARTPLIISAPDVEASKRYQVFARLVERLRKDSDYEVQEKEHSIEVSDSGYARVEDMLGREGLLQSGGLYDPANVDLMRHLRNALNAKELYKRDRDYVVTPEKEVVIVDEFTGRLMIGRRYSEGLHQAIEAKEQVKIQQESRTYATITIQNYFRMYNKLAGMTGTAATEAEEFHKIYKLDVVEIPTNREMIRQDLTDLIYRDEDSKFRAAVKDIEEQRKLGRPVLVGTVSIEKSERLSDLMRRQGIQHQTLNAKQHEKEANIIAEAGKPGAVTVATNMAGRGVDIILGGKEPEKPAGDDPELLKELGKAHAEWQKRHEEVIKAGGLHVIGTERHEARRIDNQLRGRSGRQGDPGSSRFYVSLEDDLVRQFGGDRIKGLMNWAGLGEDVAIENKLVSHTIENSQVRVEGFHFDIRKHLVDYDDVVNKHREVIYGERRKILGGANLKENILKMVADEINRLAATFIPDDDKLHWNLEGLMSEIATIMPLPPEINADKLSKLGYREVPEKLIESANALYKAREKEIGVENARVLERLVMLRVIDSLWVEHLTNMEYMRAGIGLQAIGQRDPLVAYKREGHQLFRNLLDTVQHDVAHTVFHVNIVRQEPQKETASPMAKMARPAPVRQSPRQAGSGQKVGRNDPCPCGSGKKYKHCCGK
ncbi:MAG: preprotein translocase subunit SecA [Dehalococcoidia bacterium]|nr:MAG: preprotein translocase subunit SecA [Dehalococcoidia bacterium]